MSGVNLSGNLAEVVFEAIEQLNNALGENLGVQGSVLLSLTDAMTTLTQNTQESIQAAMRGNYSGWADGYNTDNDPGFEGDNSGNSNDVAETNAVISEIQSASQAGNQEMMTGSKVLTQGMQNSGKTLQSAVQWLQNIVGLAETKVNLSQQLYS